jgi:uncharacterized protein (TIGR02145 family)
VKNLYFLLLLAAALFLSCVSIGFGDIDTCGGEKYTSGSQICENDTLKNLCGNGYYDSKIWFCSEQNTEIYKKCSGRSYNTENQICENNIIKTKCETGNNYYNPITQFCNESDVLDKCDGKEYNPLNQKCDEGILLSKCGNDYYNPLNQSQKCDEGILLSKCGNDYYNPLNQNQKCDEGILFSKCGNDYYNPLNQSQKCDEGILLSKCKNSYYNPLNQKCENDILLSKCGGHYYNPAIYFCFDDIRYEKCGNKEYNPETQFCDERDGNIYKKVTIGTQTWMGENLNFSADGTVGRCYDDATSNCAIYGKLYDLPEAMSVCPSGWHLPSDGEWNTLRDFIGSYAGTKLKADNNLWGSGKGTDDFGFTALPGGVLLIYTSDESPYIIPKFIDIGGGAFFWTYNSNCIVHYLDSSEESKLGRIIFPQTLASVRCVKDWQ